MTAVDGILRVLHHLGMNDGQHIHDPSPVYLKVKESTWLRAEVSGLLHPRVGIGELVEKGDLLATLTDPYGSMLKKVLAPSSGHVITLNESPMVYQGDAIFRLATELVDHAQ
jgi:predicted deacylase